MKILLDTHIVLWVATNSNKLTPKIRELISDRRNFKYVSIASVWEVAIKLGKEGFVVKDGVDGIFKIAWQNDFRITPIHAQHLRIVPELPRHHGDPFDRLLIATAKAEGMTIVTADENIHKYNVNWIW